MKYVVQIAMKSIFKIVKAVLNWKVVWSTGKLPFHIKVPTLFQISTDNQDTDFYDVPLSNLITTSVEIISIHIRSLWNWMHLFICYFYK